MWFWIPFLIILSACFLGFAFYGNNKAKKRESKLKIAKRELRDHGFHDSHIFKSLDYYIAFNEQLQQVACIDMRNPLAYQVIDFAKIISAEIVQDEESVIKTNVGSAIMWGAAFSSKRVEKHIKDLGIRLILDDLSNPMVYISCINSKNDIEKLYAAFVSIGNRNASVQK